MRQRDRPHLRHHERSPPQQGGMWLLSWGDPAQLSMLKREVRGVVFVEAPVGVPNFAAAAVASDTCGLTDCRKAAISTANWLDSTTVVD